MFFSKQYLLVVTKQAKGSKVGIKKYLWEWAGKREGKIPGKEVQKIGIVLIAVMTSSFLLRITKFDFKISGILTE